VEDLTISARVGGGNGGRGRGSTESQREQLVNTQHMYMYEQYSKFLSTLNI
jgi:hypothetical protein